MFKIQQATNGHWHDLGGTYSASLARMRILQFMECSSSRKPRFYRIRRAS